MPPASRHNGTHDSATSQTGSRTSATSHTGSRTSAGTSRTAIHADPRPVADAPRQPAPPASRSPHPLPAGTGRPPLPHNHEQLRQRGQQLQPPRFAHLYRTHIARLLHASANDPRARAQALRHGRRRRHPRWQGRWRGRGRRGRPAGARHICAWAGGDRGGRRRLPPDCDARDWHNGAQARGIRRDAGPHPRRLELSLRHAGRRRRGRQPQPRPRRHGPHRLLSLPGRVHPPPALRAGQDARPCGRACAAPRARQVPPPRPHAARQAQRGRARHHRQPGPRHARLDCRHAARQARAAAGLGEHASGRHGPRRVLRGRTPAHLHPGGGRDASRVAAGRGAQRRVPGHPSLQQQPQVGRTEAKGKVESFLGHPEGCRRGF
ncbi:hypothetical protein DFH27DRAFT_583165 [Peziza echinospora]|nr:hypothetical protein DFH27DRAFT_583165 [Peziza echinospora]